MKKETFIVKDQFQRNSGLRSYEINLNKIAGLEVLRIVPELPFLYVITETELPTPSLETIVRLTITLLKGENRLTHWGWIVVSVY